MTCRPSLLRVLACVLATSTGAQAATGEASRPVSFGGYVAPLYEVLRGEDSRQRVAGEVGLRLEAAPAPNLELTLAVMMELFRREVTAGPSTGSEPVGSFTLNRQVLSEATLSYRPAPALTLKGGQLRLPFTYAQQTPNSELTFPARARTVEAFSTGSEHGGLARLQLFDQRAVLMVGAFSGAGVGRFGAAGSTSGPQYLARAEVSPLGAFRITERHLPRSQLRLGLGAGVLYQPPTASRPGETRLSLSARAEVAGLQAVLEHLRHRAAHGTSLQATYVWLPGRVALGPVSRVATLVGPGGRSSWVEAGLAVYPFADATSLGAVRGLLAYLGERPTSAAGTAHGVTAQLHVRF